MVNQRGDCAALLAGEGLPGVGALAAPEKPDEFLSADVRWSGQGVAPVQVVTQEGAVGSYSQTL